MGVIQPGHVAVLEAQNTEPLLSARRGEESAAARDLERLERPTEDRGQGEPPGEPPEAGREEDGTLGRFVAGVLQTVFPGRAEALSSPRVAGIVGQLRRRVGVAFCCTACATLIAVWLLLRSVAAYSRENPACGGPLHVWLLGFMVLQLAWPVCMPSMTLLLLGWCLGAALLLDVPRGCHGLREFLLEATALQALQSMLLISAALAALTGRPLLRRLGELLTQRGTDPEIARLIAVLPAGSVAADEECVVCLSREDEEGVPWRELTCGHRFHEPCLLQWLTKARRCPICRTDLHAAYRRPDAESAASEGSA